MMVKLPKPNQIYITEDQEKNRQQKAKKEEVYRHKLGSLPNNSGKFQRFPQAKSNKLQNEESTIINYQETNEGNKI